MRRKKKKGKVIIICTLGTRVILSALPTGDPGRPISLVVIPSACGFQDVRNKGRELFGFVFFFFLSNKEMQKSQILGEVEKQLGSNVESYHT